MAVISAVLLLSMVLCCEGYLSTSGRWIVNEQGNRVRLTCVNWYGADQKDFVVGGLQWQTIQFVSKYIRDLNFNCIRLPWSVEMYVTNPIINNSTILAKEPSLLGTTALNILDHVVNTLTSNGLYVILDNHVSDANWCCSNSDGNGLWYTPKYPEEVWISSWTGLVQRYRSNTLVVGADLRNELRTACNPTCITPTWGSGNSQSDWRAAAIRCGNAILGVNPQLLIIVEGLNYALDLTGVKSHPIQLNQTNKLVYEAHNYEWDYTITTYQSFKSTLDQSFGYIMTEGQSYTAPVWLGEYGTCHTSVSCVDSSQGQGLWFQFIVQYIEDYDMGWAYWAVDGTQSSGDGRTYGAEEGYGILNTTWNGVALQEMMDVLKPIMS